ncbi:hypothetical protein MYX76_14880 [Desulfobacterota bacterium AH_259_B03_O07]|nr:hypothetical protein [Desulfobacterota bacterium AH_259_B03_O07]
MNITKAEQKLKDAKEKGRRCSKCKKVKPLSEFHRDNRPSLVIKYRASCKDCDYDRQEQYYKENKEVIKEWRKKYKKIKRTRKSDKAPRRKYRKKAMINIQAGQTNRRLIDLNEQLINGRICSDCGELKSYDSFPYKPNRVLIQRDSYCIECKKKRHQKWYRKKRNVKPEYFEVRNQKEREKYTIGGRGKIRKRLDELYKTWLLELNFRNMTHCFECGYNKCLRALDYHHVDPTIKDHTLGAIVKLLPTNERLKELEDVKCLCVNCHRIIHDKARKSDLTKRYVRHKLKCIEEWKLILEKRGMLHCTNCGINSPFSLLDYHHIDEKKKKYQIGQIIRRKPTPDLIAELDKVTCLCARCHQETHCDHRHCKGFLQQPAEAL